MRRTTRRRWRAGTAPRSTTGGTVEQVQTWPDRMRAVTADEVREAARRWLDKRRSVTGYLVKDTRARGETLVNMLMLLPPRRASSLRRLAGAALHCRSPRRAGDQDRARGQPERHRGLAGARCRPCR